MSSILPQVKAYRPRPQTLQTASARLLDSAALSPDGDQDPAHRYTGIACLASKFGITTNPVLLTAATGIRYSSFNGVLVELVVLSLQNVWR